MATKDVMTFHYGFKEYPQGAPIHNERTLMAKNMDDARKTIISMFLMNGKKLSKPYIALWNERSGGCLYLNYRGTVIWTSGSRVYTVSPKTGKLSGGEQVMW